MCVNMYVYVHRVCEKKNYKVKKDGKKRGEGLIYDDDRENGSLYI